MNSIDWLIEQIKEYDFTPPSNNEEYVIVMPKWIFDAKRNESLEMHKQEIIDAVDSNFTYSNNEYPTLGEQYYHKTFVSNGSDDHISDISKMVEVPQQEISDEEILKQGNYLFPNIADVFRKDTWEMGAKWYREQLKSKQ